jgi:hypothetical protein
MGGMTSRSRCWPNVQRRSGSERGMVSERQLGPRVAGLSTTAGCLQYLSAAPVSASRIPPCRVVRSRTNWAEPVGKPLSSGPRSTPSPTAPLGRGAASAARMAYGIRDRIPAREFPSAWCQQILDGWTVHGIRSFYVTRRPHMIWCRGQRRSHERRDGRVGMATQPTFCDRRLATSCLWLG